jgi:RNA polymerase-binding transcription factor DksA
MGAYAARLASERTATAERLESLRRQFGAVVAAAEGSNADDEHDPEGSTIAYERSQLAALVEQAQRTLVEITAAQERLADGTYGVCARCGHSIPPGRLEARPIARTCVDCAGR